MLLVESPIEAILLGALFRVRGRSTFTVATQVDAEASGRAYRIDIVISRGESRVGIECDGAQFHSAPDQVARDLERQERLRVAGWTLIRFTGSAIHRDPRECAERALDRLEEVEMAGRRLVDRPPAAAPASASPAPSAEFTEEEHERVASILRELRARLAKRPADELPPPSQHDQERDP